MPLTAADLLLSIIRCHSYAVDITRFDTAIRFFSMLLLRCLLMPLCRFYGLMLPARRLLLPPKMLFLPLLPHFFSR